MILLNMLRRKYCHVKSSETSVESAIALDNQGKLQNTLSGDALGAFLNLEQEFGAEGHGIDP